jgi:hypothetical protein
VYEPEAGSHQELTDIEQAKETAKAGFSAHIDGHRNTSMDGSASDVHCFVAVRSSRERSVMRPLQRRLQTSIPRRCRFGWPGLGFVLQSALPVREVAPVPISEDPLQAAL